jgi:hypothetical protein
MYFVKRAATESAVGPGVCATILSVAVRKREKIIEQYLMRKLIKL